MSERDKYIKEWNAITYLRDFISTDLILSPREQAVWDYLMTNSVKPSKYFYNKPKRGTPTKGYRCCKRCGEIKTVEEFYDKSIICEQCRQAEKYICKS